MERAWTEGATPDETAKLDEIAITLTGPTLDRMLLRAGACLAREIAARDPLGKVAILVGPGVNGAGGLECAMALHERRIKTIVVPAIDRPVEATRSRLDLARQSGCVFCDVEDAKSATTVVDALLGYRARGAPRAIVAQMLDGLGPRRVVSLDVPTGRDASTGEPHAQRVVPDLVVAIACVKTGILTMDPRPPIVVIDVGIPRHAYAMVGLERPPFVDGRVELPASTRR